MGYTIIIGEHIPRQGDTPPSAKSVELPEAPASGEMTDHTNERWPSYTGWGDFLEEVGLMYLSPRTAGGESDPECPPLMDEHPGVMPVLPIHLERVRAAKTAYHKRVGRSLKPRSNASVPEQNLVRLVWLEFWLDWALKNCKTPVCANS